MLTISHSYHLTFLPSHLLTFSPPPISASSFHPHFFSCVHIYMCSKVYHGKHAVYPSRVIGVKCLMYSVWRIYIMKFKFTMQAIHVCIHGDADYLIRMLCVVRVGEGNEAWSFGHGCLAWVFRSSCTYSREPSR